MIVDVNLGSRSYRIVVASGALQSVGERLRELRLGSRAALVSDGAIMRLYGKTVVAQVDASIGGKTAIDHPLGKNMIGAFHQPRLVVVDPAVARTLPEREFRSGLAEIVKHGIVLDADYFAELERDLAPLAARDLGVLERIIGGSCRLKASVVERDEREAELRHVLNYGHTIGHALEAATGYTRYAHGEAVSLGIVAEARLARRLGIADDETTTRQERMLETLGLPVRAPSIDVEPIVSAMARDKKA